MSYQSVPLSSLNKPAERLETVRYQRRQQRKRRRVARIFRNLLLAAALAGAVVLSYPTLRDRTAVWRAENASGLLPFFRSDSIEDTGFRFPVTPDAASDPRLRKPVPRDAVVDLADDGAADAAETAETDEEYLVWPNRYEPDDVQKFSIGETASTFYLSQNMEETAIHSAYVVLLDAKTGNVLAERTPDAMINPASMTKVLTLLTAVEAIQSGDVHPNGTNGWGKGMDSGVAVIDQPIRDYCWENECSVAGFERYEIIPVRDLLYACILPSGADGCLGLANFVSGSHAAFVERMNRKLADMGLADQAHFTNCVGLYDPDHHCTVKAMATIMKAAMDNELCREVLGTRYYRTVSTEQHPDGILLTNLFIRRIEDKFVDSPIQVIGAKTGYVRQSGNCAVSFAHREDGQEFVCVTGMGWGTWGVINDHAELYQKFCGG